MSSIADLIANQVKAAAGGSGLQSNVLSGLSDSVLKSFKQTASSAEGVSQIMSLLSNSSSASTSPITKLASQIFSSQVAGKLGLSSSVTNTATGLLPVIISKLVSAVSSKESGFDVSSILSALGASSSSSSTSTLGKLAGTLGKLFKR